MLHLLVLRRGLLYTPVLLRLGYNRRVCPTPAAPLPLPMRAARQAVLARLGAGSRDGLPAAQVTWPAGRGTASLSRLPSGRRSFPPRLAVPGPRSGFGRPRRQGGRARP